MAEILEIDQKFLDNLEKADKSLENLVDTTEELSDSFSDLVSGNLDAVAEKLGRISEAVGHLGDAKVGDMGLKTLGDVATEAADKVNSVATAVSNIKNTKKSGKGTEDENSFFLGNTVDLKRKIKEQIELVEQYEKARNKIRNKYSSRVKNENINKDTQEFQKLEADYNAARKNLSKAKRDLKKLQQEFNTTQNQNISAIQRLDVSLLDRMLGDEDDFVRISKAKAVLAEIKSLLHSPEPIFGSAQEQQEFVDKLRVIEKTYKDLMTSSEIQRYNEELLRLKTRQREEDEAAAELAKKRAAAPFIDPKAELEAYAKRKEEVAKINEKLATFQASIASDVANANNLRNAIKALDKSEGNYKEKKRMLNEELAIYNNRIRQAYRESELFRESQNKLLSVLSQAKGIISSYFSIYAIANFTKKMVQVTGEFELQNRALQAILQNKDEANRLWQQTVDLAVKSPFTVKELVTYTKQLAAYRVETSKLHGTTKMLADISAGLGVEMNRLVLAYGQVKAANYLRGTELRQFSEAGINILEELRDYYAEVENKILSVGDVFEMVSRREVSFGDVEAVLQRVTGKGGPFYRMQEIQAETVKGMMSNLQDSFDIMMNDIGESTEGVIKGVLTVTKKLLDNWETVLKVVTAVVATYGTFKTMLTLTNASTIAQAMTFKTILKDGQTMLSLTQLIKLKWFQLISGVKELGDGQQVVSFTNSLKNFATQGGLVALAIAAIAVAIVSLVRKAKRIREINKEFDEARRTVQNFAASFKEAEGDFESMESHFQELAYYANTEYNIDVNVNTAKLSVEGLAEEFNNLSAKIYNTATLLRQLKLAFEENKGWFIFGGKRGESAEKDLKQFSESYSNFVAIMANAIPDGMKKAEESEIEYIERLSDAWQKMHNENPYDMDPRVLRAWTDFYQKGNNAAQEMTDVFHRWRINAESDIDAVKAGINSIANDQKVSNLIPWLYEQVKQYGVEIPVEVVPSTSDENLSAWQKEFKRLFGEETIGKDLSKYVADVLGDIDLTEARQKAAEMLSSVSEELAFAESINPNEWYRTALGIQVQADGKNREEYIDNLRQGKKIIEQEVDYLGRIREESKNRNEEESRSINRRIDLLKDMRSEYEKLSETFTELEAKQRIIDSYAETFADAMAGTGKAISDYDFTGDAGLLEMLRALKPFAAQEGREISLLLAKEISSTQATMDVEIRTVQNEQVLQSIEDLFTGYEVGLQLEELNIPPELAKELFGLDSIDLDSLRAQVASKLPLLTGGEALKQHEEYLKKIDEMEEKAQMERVKKYSEYLLKSNNEFVTAQLDALRQLREIDQTFTDPAKREAARGGVLRELNEKEQKMQWDSFQSSDMYIMMFEDIENMGTKAIEILLNRLQDLRSNLTDLPPSDLKEIVNQINKLETELATRNPFTSIRDTIEEINSLGDIGALQEQVATLSDRQDVITAQLDAYNTISQASEKGLTMDAGTASWQNYVQLMSDASESGKTLEEYVAQITQESEDNAKNLNEATDELDKQNKALQKIEAKIANYNANLEAIKTIYSSITEVAGAFGEETDGSLNTIIETGFALGELVSKYLEWKKAQEAGNAAKNLASGPLGWIVLAVQALMTIISLVAKLSENRKAKRIENIRKDIERLNTAMEDLKEAIDAAFSFSQLQDYSEQTKANIEDQIRLQKQIIKLREKGYTSKKEREEINAAKEEIEELEKEKEEILRDILSTATAGILDNTLDAARGFVDAWYDAFQETGDGMQGLEKNFQEMLVNMLKQQATLGIAGAFADKWKQELTKYINEGDLTFTTSEAQQWVETVKKDFPELSAALEAYFEALRGAGVEIEDAGELGTLQRGIQGITETQADVIAAYLNSLRFFVQQGNQDRLNFFASFSNPDTPNPILSQLKAIAKNTEAIYTLLDSVSGTNHPKGGSGIKVFID